MNNLKKIRESKNITQSRLSIEIGVPQQTISSYESGKSKPSIKTLCKMAEFLNTSTDFLLDKTDIIHPINQLVSNGLHKEELQLISMFRKLPTNRQRQIIGNISGLIDQ
jgi:transcriptional regulator with XRE-family HTH domain